MRTLADVVKKMKGGQNKESLKKLLDLGGLIYELDNKIVYDDGYMIDNWNTNNDLKAMYNNFDKYAKTEAEYCLKIAGMTDEEIENELSTWDFHDFAQKE